MNEKEASKMAVRVGNQLDQEWDRYLKRESGYHASLRERLVTREFLMPFVGFVICTAFAGIALSANYSDTTWNTFLAVVIFAALGLYCLASVILGLVTRPEIDAGI